MSEDLKRYKALQNLIKQATFDLKGEAVVTAAVLLNWFDKQESKFKTPPIPKEKEEAISEL